MLKFDLANQTNFTPNLNLITKVVRAFNRQAKNKSDGNFSLVFTDGPTIRKWNRIYRGKDKITDVLSFAEADAEFSGHNESKDLGEILICVSRAKSQAKEYGWSIDEEINRLLVHGLAHLIGYEHEGVSKKEEKKMIDFEKKVLTSL